MFAKPVVVEDFRVAGVAAPHDVTLDAHLVHFAGALLPGRHYDREVRLTNVGTAPCGSPGRARTRRRGGERRMRLYSYSKTKPRVAKGKGTL